MAARLHGHGDGGPAPLLPLARQPEKRDWLRALHVAAVLAMVALVVSVVCWLQLDGRRMRQTEADWLEALELPTVEELDALIPNRHHLWARPFGGVFGKGPGKTFTRNAFGRDVRRLRLQGEATWPALCALDSDKDGLTNGEELGDPCCGSAPAWTRRWNLTHPGWKQQTLTETQLADVGPRRTIRKGWGPAPASGDCDAPGAAAVHEAQFLKFYYMRHASDLVAGDSQRSLKYPAFALIVSLLARWARGGGLLEDLGLAAPRPGGAPLSRRTKAAVVVAAYLWTDLVAGLTHLTFDFAPWDYPVIGGVARGFQFHHVHPTAWVVVPVPTLFSHSFLLLGALSLGLHLLTPRRPMRLFWVVSFALCLVTVLTHRWVHLEPAALPLWFRACQKVGLLMSHEHHQQHHKSLVTQFSNLSGVTDSLLNALTRYVPATHFQHWLTVMVAVFAATIVAGADPRCLRPRARLKE